MKYDLAIFDLDGTILDTLDDLTTSVNYALKTAGYPTRDKENIRSFLGNGAKVLIKKSLPEGVAVEKIDEVLGLFRDHYKVHCDDVTVPYNGITDLFKTLKKTGCNVAVLSNKPDYAVQQLCHEHFEGLLDDVAGEIKGTPKKPAPDGVESLMRRFDADRSATVYIGDSEVDIATAANSGVDCITVDWGFRDHQALIASGAEHIVSTTDELRDLLLE